MAETLLALVIIGVIAAITIPSMNKNIQRKEMQTGVKKAYSVLNAALDKSRLNLGFYPDCYYYGIAQAHVAGCDYLNKELFKNLNLLKVCENNGVANGCMPRYKGSDTALKESRPDISDDEFHNYQSGCGNYTEAYLHTNTKVYVLADGMILIPYVWYAPRIIAVDVNGKKGPNKWGHDLFTFQLTGDSEGYSAYAATESCMVIEKGGTTASNMITR